MRSIAVFNNKGGVGKSTITLFIADFFSSTSVSVGDRPARVLVVDLDAQASSAVALVGQTAVEKKQRQGYTLGTLITRLIENQRPSVADYVMTRRPGSTAGKKIPLGQLWVMVSDGDSTRRAEETYGDECTATLVRDLWPLLAKEYDFVLFDLPANIDGRNYLPMAGLCAARHILIPTEPSKITVNAMSRTFDILRDVQGAARQRGYEVPRLVGVVLNKTDKRTRQYRLHAKEIGVMAGQNDSLVFDSFPPSAPALATASDDSLQFDTLRERYDSYYDKVRDVARELVRRCGYSMQKKAQRKTAAAAKRAKAAH